MSSNVQPGQRVGEYVLEEPIGRGGFATVWRAAHHAWPDRKVAAKVLHDPEQAHLLRQEAECLSQLDHPGIAGAVGMDLDHDPPYLLLELHEGETLRDVMGGKPLPPAEAYRIFSQLVTALAHSHEHGIAHGDLKPENVLVAPDGRVKLTDFGLGRIRAGEASLLLSGALASRTQSEAALAGTLPYMAPEQREGEAPCPRTDVFALGILLHELVTGRRPQPGDDPRDELTDPPAWLDVWERTFTRRDRRFADAGELLEALGVPAGREGDAGEGPLVPAVATLGPWTIEAIERAVASELGLPLGRLLGGPNRPTDGVDRLIAWAEEQITGGERELREGRRIVWYVATEVLGVSPAALADRYGVSSQEVRAGARSVPKGGVRLASWRSVVERLAPLPAPLQRGLRETERGPGAGRFMAAVMAWWMALVCAVLGVFKPPLLALVPAFVAAGWLAVRRANREHAWLDEHLQAVPGADERTKLTQLALHTEFPRVAAAARARLDALAAGAVAAREGPVEALPAEAEPAEAEPAEAEPAEAEEERAEEERRLDAPSVRSLEAVQRALEAERPEAERPEAERPEAERPEAESPEAESPVAESPVAESPGAESPEAESPEAESPVAESPVAESPGAESPEAESPEAESPEAESPVAESPVAESPVAESPGAESPGAESPGAESPVAESPPRRRPIDEAIREVRQRDRDAASPELEGA